RIVMLLTAAALAGWTGWPESPVAGALLVAAGLAGFARLVRWRGPRTITAPLGWSLHLGFAWLPAGLLLTGLAPLAGLPPAAGMHALGAGAIGAMKLAVMTRASLGHSGRPLVADRATTTIYALVHAAALLRVAAAFAEAATLPLLWASAAAWIAAFALFALHYGPLLLPRKRMVTKPETPSAGRR
ncbi:MAG: NnrS family protein, partial [Alphaproteobacteria bacterium]